MSLNYCDLEQLFSQVSLFLFYKIKQVKEFNYVFNKLFTDAHFMQGAFISKCWQPNN